MMALALSTLLSVAAFVGILFWVNVQSARSWELFLFYASLFFASAGLSTLTGIFIRRIRKRRFATTAFLPTALRQGLILAGVFVILLLLQRSGLLSWYALAGVFALAIFLEFLFSQIFEYSS